MLKMSSLDEVISVYYDEQMSESELLNYEARMARSDCVRNYTYEKCFEFYKISNSINLVRNRLNTENFRHRELFKIKSKESLIKRISELISFKR